MFRSKTVEKVNTKRYTHINKMKDIGEIAYEKGCK